MDRETIIFFENWKSKRRSTFFVFCYMFFNNGFEQTLTVTTLWLYVKKSVTEVNDKRFYYAVISAAYLFPTTLFTGVASTYSDRTREIKILVLIINLLGMIGGIIYMIPVSPYCLIIGNFLSGFSLLLRPIMLGEIARCYPIAYVKQKFPILHNCYSAGTAFGPCFILIFLKLNVRIGNISFTYENIGGLIRAIASLMTFIIAILYVSNISKEFDYKKELVEFENENYENDVGIVSLILKAVSTKETLYCLSASFFSNVIEACFYYILPLIINVTLGYEDIFINICYVSPLLVYVILTAVILKFFINMSMLKCAINSWMIVPIAGALLLFLNRSNSMTVNIFLLIIMTSIIEIFSFGTFLYLSVTLANLVQSKHQISIDSLRNQSRQSAIIFGGVIASYGVSHVSVLFYGMMALVAIMLISCFLQRDNLRNPRIVI